MNTTTNTNTQPATNNTERTIRDFSNLTLEQQREILRGLVSILADAGASVPAGATHALR